MINPLSKINELTKFNREINVEIYYVDFKKTDEKGMSNFNDCIDEYEIYINNNLNTYEEMKALSHETGHILADSSTLLSPIFIVESGERRAENWACQYIITYEDIVGTLKDWSIRNDWEAAQLLGVDLTSLRKAVRRCELEGLPVRRSDFVLDWRQWDY